MKIFVDGYLLNKEHQGTKTYIRELYKEFANQNPNMLIFIGCFKDPKIEMEFAGHKNVSFINYQKSNRVLRMLFEIPKIISKNKFDFAHFQYIIPFATSKSCKYIVTVHDILFNDFKNYFSINYRLIRNLLFKFSSKKADFLLTVSSYSKERIKYHYKIYNKEIFITPNGVSEEYFKNYNKEESIKYIETKYCIKNFILYVSRIEPRKNQQGLLKAFLNIETENISLVFIGFKSINNYEFDALLNDLTPAQKTKIHVLQDISEEDLMFFYNAAKLFVYPSLAEGFGIPPLEAGALKTPVLCSNKTAMTDFDFFEPNLIDVDDFEIFKISLRNSISNNNHFNLEIIQKTINEKYSWKKSSDILTTITKS